MPDRESIRDHLDGIFKAAAATGTAAETIGPPMIRKSWERCLHNFGLDPGRVHKPVVLSSTELTEYRDRADEIAWCAKGEIQRLYRRLGDLGYVILLTDDNGVTIDYLGNDGMRDVLREAGLYLGAVWAEDNQGTNGVGTCLQEGVSLSVVMDDHFAAHNIGLTCTVAPIRGPDGDVRAVLDISTDRPTSREIQAVLRTVVENAAQRIENNLFCRHHRPHWLLSLARDPEVMDEADRAYLAVDDSGRTLAIDHRLRQLLAVDGKQAVPGRPIQEVIGLTMEDIARIARQSSPVALADGGPFPFLSVQSSPDTPSGRAMPARTRPARIRPRPALPTAAGPLTLDALAGWEPSLQHEVGVLRRLTHSGLPILFTGETGTGKEAFARAFHREGPRAAKPFVAVNCAALPESLIEAELFGYRAGAFTGANPKGARGKILAAEGGVLFLDEIGDMPLASQTRLLRVLAEGEVTPLGDGEPRKVNIQIVCATHRNLAEEVEAGRFRADLLYRLNAATFSLPPLRDRHDRARLIETCLARVAGEREPGGLLSAEAMRILAAHDWPGNMRELSNVLTYAVAVSDGGPIEPEHLPPGLARPGRAGQDDADCLRAALAATGGHATEAASRLGISRATLYRRLGQHGIDPGDFRL